jgi:hypothetical protein
MNWRFLFIITILLYSIAGIAAESESHEQESSLLSGVTLTTEAGGTVFRVVGTDAFRAGDRSGFGGGLLVNIDLSAHYKLQTGTMLMQEGSGGETLLANYYFMIPILAKYDVFSTMHTPPLTVKAGVAPALLVNPATTTNQQGPEALSMIKTFDLQVVAGIESGFALTKRMDFLVDVMIMHGLTDVSKELSAYNQGFYAGIGLVFR